MAIKPSQLAIGTQAPFLKPDKGAGQWNSQPVEAKMYVLKAILTGKIAGLPTAVQVQYAPLLALLATGLGIQALASHFGGDDAVKHLLHYLGNTGYPLTIDFAGMNDEVPLAQQVADLQVQTAQKFIEARPPGKINFTSTTGSLNHYISQNLSRNWFFAVGSYSTWINGTANVKSAGGKPLYSMDYELHFVDRYNWDGNKSVDIPIPGYSKCPPAVQSIINSLPHVKNGQLHVTDKFMAKFHLQGLAKEYDMQGTIEKTITWQPTAGFVTYKVKVGDTLSLIAKAFYGDASKYPTIQVANKATLPKASLLKVGQELKIPTK